MITSLFGQNKIFGNLVAESKCRNVYFSEKRSYRFESEDNESEEEDEEPPAKSSRSTRSSSGSRGAANTSSRSKRYDNSILHIQHFYDLQSPVILKNTF